MKLNCQHGQPLAKFPSCGERSESRDMVVLASKSGCLLRSIVLLIHHDSCSLLFLLFAHSYLICERQPKLDDPKQVNIALETLVMVIRRVALGHRPSDDTRELGVHGDIRITLHQLTDDLKL